MSGKSAYGKIYLNIVIVLGLLGSWYYFLWWFEDWKIADPLFAVTFVLALCYAVPQVFFFWYIILHMKYPDKKEELGGLSVDVFLPVYNEAYELIENSLKAAVEIKYPHTTYAIDDGRKLEHMILAGKYGAEYITRNENHGNKAGNINNAMKASSGEFIAVFDIDHIPQKDYLDKIMGCFRDGKVGVVQVPLDHYNENDGFIAGANSKMNDDFFGPSTLGMYGLECTTVFGSNSVFRRSALESIGGYKTGLAEDLNTSVALHAAGWKSDYVPEILAKGLVPSDIISHFKQQLKWSRGVFETLFRIYPRLISRLNLKKNICYLTRMTYYLTGPVIALHILAVLIALLHESSASHLEDYLYHLVPFLSVFILSRVFSGKKYQIKTGGEGSGLKGLMVVFGTWPIYTFSLIYALFDIPLPFIPTPKHKSRQKLIKRMAKLLLPQIAAVAVMTAAIVFHLVNGGLSLLVLMFALALTAAHAGIFYAAYMDWFRVRNEEETKTGRNQPGDEFSEKLEAAS